MRPDNAARDLTSSGELRRGVFELSWEDSAHIMGILRDGLYTDKILAVLREYGSNAWDAHREAGKHKLPIKVTLPTQFKPTLAIRDWGLGLSEDDVFNVYTKYGKSTKRDSDDVVGTLGIGCLLAGQPIVTIDGMKAVEDIMVGDMVLTHQGRFRRVTETMERPYRGLGYEIHLSQGSRPLVLTEEHPVLVGDSEGDTRWVLPSKIEDGYRTRKKGIRAWSSYAVLPASLEATETHIKVLDHLDETFYFTQGVLTRKASWEAVHSPSSKAYRSSRHTRWPRFPETLKLDEDLGWLLGIYAAEGSCNTKQTTLSFSSSEDTLAERVQKILENRFGIHSSQHARPKKGILEVVAHHRALAPLLGDLCGRGSHNKKVPHPIMNGPREARKGFLRGVFDGDGSSTRQRFVFGVSSPCLAWGVRTLMAIVDGKWGTVGTMEDYPGRWSIHYNREASWSYSFREKGNLFRPIREVRPLELDTTVYNFSVEEDESYVSDFVLHNCKSGFAYSDQFTVTSWHGGMKKVYLAVLDPSDKGEMNKLHEEPCGNDETGVEIQIPVQPRDIPIFHTKAQAVFAHFTPRPEINTDLPEIQWVPRKHGFVYDDDNLDGGYYHSTYSFKEWIAVMGCIPYRIDLNQIRAELDEEDLSTLLTRVRGGLYFAIGEVRISANREELKYTEKTKAAILAKLRGLFDEYLEDLFAQITKSDITPWERRKKAVFISRTLRLSVPIEHAAWAVQEVKVWSNDKKIGPNLPPKTFRFQRDKHAVRSVPVTRDSCLYLWDDTRKLSGYQVEGGATIVIPKEDTKIKDVKAELARYIKKAGIEGIEVKNLSQCPWSSYWRAGPPERIVNEKHQVRSFKLKHNVYVHGVQSNNWEIVEREPTDDDVFVIISHFKALNISNLYGMVQRDRNLAAWLGLKFPEIHAYKTTVRKPISKEDCKGTHYLDWRSSFFFDYVWEDVKRRRLLQLWRWRQIFANGHSSPRVARNPERYLQVFTEKFGADHQITRILTKHCKATKAFLNVPRSEKDRYQDLVHTVKLRRRPAPTKAVDDLKAAYPLIAQARYGLLDVFTFPKKESEPWFEYVNLIDRAKAGSDGVSKKASKR